MNKTKLGVLLYSLLGLGCVTAHAQVERVTSLTVSNPAAMVANIDHYLAAGESEAQSVTLLRHLHDGADPSTHTIVAIFDDLETMESSMDRQATSAAWASVVRSGASISTVNGSALAIQRVTYGDDTWEGGDYLAAVLVRSPDGPRWLEAMDDMNRASNVENPGMVRIVRLRGAPEGATHAVLLVSSSYAGLINYMEQVEVSDAFATMRGSTETRPVGTTIYQVAKVWNP